MDLFGGLVRSLGKTTDELYLGATVRDVNDFFENELQFLTEYHSHLKEAALRTERMTKKHKEVADSEIKISSNLMLLSTAERGNMEKFLAKTAEIFEKTRVCLFSYNFNHYFNLILSLLCVFACRIWKDVYQVIKTLNQAIHCDTIKGIVMLQKLY